MTYNCTDSIAETVSGISLCPGVDVYIDFTRDPSLTVCVWWHHPSINLGWYPICQIDVGGKICVFHREGAENPEHWRDLLLDAAEFIRKYV